MITSASSVSVLHPVFRQELLGWKLLIKWVNSDLIQRWHHVVMHDEVHLNHRKTEFHSSLFEPIGNKRNRPIIRRPGIDIDGSLPAKKLGDRFGLAAGGRNEAQRNLLIGGVIARRHRVFAIGNINHPVAIGETCGNQQLAASFTICVALTPSTAIR